MRASFITALALSAALASAAPAVVSSFLNNVRNVDIQDNRAANKYDFHYARAEPIDVHLPHMRGLDRRVSKSPAKPAGQPAQQQSPSQPAKQQQAPPTSQNSQQNQQQQQGSTASQKQNQKNTAPSSSAGSSGGGGGVGPLDKVGLGLGSNALGKRVSRVTD